MWSFSKWIESKSLMFQLQFYMIFRALPYLIGYIMITMNFYTTRAIYPPDDPMRTLMMILQVIAPGVSVTAVGMIIVEGYVSRIREITRKDKAIAATFWWSPTEAEDVENVLSKWEVLSEKVLGGLVSLTTNDPTTEALDVARDFQRKYGYYYYSLTFAKPFEDHGDIWRNMILLADFPFENFIRDSMNIYLMNAGVIVEAPAPKLQLVYCTEFKELRRDGEFGLTKVFRLGFDSERAYAIQNALGLKPAEVDKKNVENAIQLDIDHTAMYWGTKSRESDAILQTYISTHKDSSEKAVSQAGKFIKNSDDIRKTQSRIYNLTKRTNLIKYAFFALLILFIAVNYGWIKW